MFVFAVNLHVDKSRITSIPSGKMSNSATEGELISQIDNVRGEQELLNVKLSRILEEAVSKPLEEKMVFISEMKEIQSKIEESMDLMRSLQASFFRELSQLFDLSHIF